MGGFQGAKCSCFYDILRKCSIESGASRWRVNLPGLRTVPAPPASLPAVHLMISVGGRAGGGGGGTGRRSKNTV